MPDIIVEAAFSVGASTSTWFTLDDTARGVLGVATLASGTVWSDISAYVRSFTIHRGSSRVDGPLVRYEPGACSVVLANPDRRFDPTNLAGPYTAAGATEVTPMRAIRIRATWAGVTYDLFRAYADAWDVAWSDPNWSEVTLTATDAFKILANHSRPAAAAVGAGEDSGARVGRILNSVGWSATDRIIATGNSTLQATTLEGDALAELQLVTDSEIGELYVDGAGRLVFRNRVAILQDARSNTPQATFGDGGGSELGYHGLGISYDDTQFVNYVRVTRVGGTEQAVQDTTSQAMYLTRTFERSDLLLQTDADALSYARWVLYQSKDPELRFDSLQVKAHGDGANLFPQVLGREIGDRITVIRRPPGGGSPITRDAFIRGITHEWAPATWTTGWTLQSATKSAFFTLDNASLGALDANALAY